MAIRGLDSDRIVSHRGWLTGLLRRTWARVAPRTGVALVVVAVNMFSTTPAEAAKPTCTTIGNYFAGRYRLDYYEGISAFMTARSGPLCGNNSTAANFSTSWTLVASNDLTHWVQSGVYHDAVQPAIHHFSQVYNASPYYVSTVPGSMISSGENHQYWQQYQPSCNCIFANVDVTTFDSTFPIASWAVPFSLQASGEVGSKASDIPGTPLAHTRFSAIQLQDLNHSWSLVACPSGFIAKNDNTTRWKVGTYACPQNDSTFDVWTQTP